MSYYEELQKLIKEGHDPDTSPEVANLRAAYINVQYGGNDIVNVSTVGRVITRTAAFEEDAREADWLRDYNQQNLEQSGNWWAGVSGAIPETPLLSWLA